jgi:hypothetical protein
VPFTPKALAVTFGAANKVYDATTVATVTLDDNRIGADIITINHTANFSDKNAGPRKTVNVTGVTLAGVDAGNYIVASSGSAVADVTPRGITVTAADASKVYGNPDPTLTFSLGGAGLVGGDTISGVITGALARAPGENVVGGPYAINRGTLATSNNYSVTAFTPGKFRITPRALTIAADNKSKFTGDALPPLTATYSGAAPIDTPASFNGSLVLATPASALSPPGAYAITPSGLSSGNYTITYVDGALRIVNRPPLAPGVLGALASVQSTTGGAGTGMPAIRAAMGAGGTGGAPQGVSNLITVAGDGMNLPPGVSQ